MKFLYIFIDVLYSVLFYDLWYKNESNYMRDDMEQDSRTKMDDTSTMVTDDQSEQRNENS